MWTRLAILLADAGRLMVGVGNYDTYLQHMQEHHPGATPLSRAEHLRHCMDNRYAGKGGKPGKCPC